MHRPQQVSAQKLLIILTVPTVSLCLTFILLYIIKPFQPSPTPVVSQATSEEKATNTAIMPPVSFSDPVELRIANLKVVAPIAPVGLTLEGDMDIDENPERTAWYKLGPKPGEEGSAVIAGHYGWKNGLGSVFNDVHTLVKGDEVVVMGQNGQKLTFVVTYSQVYAPNQDATNVFKSDDGKAHLNLITCQGQWNNKLSTYSERLVVFTDFVKQESPTQPY